LQATEGKLGPRNYHGKYTSSPNTLTGFFFFFFIAALP
jgi:hypothetical protein